MKTNLYNQKLNLFTIIFSICCITIFLSERSEVIAQENLDQSESLAQALAAMHEAEKIAVSQLNTDTALWTDSSRRKELAQLLSLVRSLKSENAVEPLLRNIDVPADSFETSGVSQNYPAVGCLVEIGIPSIVPLINLIKDTSKYEEDTKPRIAPDGTVLLPKDQSQIIALASHALIEIYNNPAGYGEKLVLEVLAGEVRKSSTEAEANALRLAISYIKKLKK